MNRSDFQNAAADALLFVVLLALLLVGEIPRDDVDEE